MYLIGSDTDLVTGSTRPGIPAGYPGSEPTGATPVDSKNGSAKMSLRKASFPSKKASPSQQPGLSSHSREVQLPPSVNNRCDRGLTNQREKRLLANNPVQVDAV